jgi:hypothetical protein
MERLRLSDIVAYFSSLFASIILEKQSISSIRVFCPEVDPTFVQNLTFEQHPRM